MAYAIMVVKRLWEVHVKKKFVKLTIIISVALILIIGIISSINASYLDFLV